MEKYQFSYWLEANPDENSTHSLEDVKEALAASSLAPKMAFWIDADRARVCGELAEDTERSIEKDNAIDIDIAHAVAKIAREFPDFSFALEESDEVDHSHVAKTEWRGERCLGSKFARTLRPDEMDDETIALVVDFLKKSDQDHAAGLVEEHFKTKFE